MNGTITPNIFDRLALLFGRALKVAPQPGDLYPRPGAGGMPGNPISFPGWDAYEQAGYGQQAGRQDEQRARQWIQSSTVYACIQAIANELSTANVVLKRRTDEGEEDVDNAPFEVRWERPNPIMGRGYLMQYWAWQLLLSGRAYLYARPVGGQLAELWPVPSWYLTVVPDRDGLIKGYAFKKPNAESTPVFIEAKYICYSRLPNPFDIYDGLAPGAAGNVAISSDIAMAQWNLQYFSEDNGVPSGLVSVPKDMLDQDIARVRMELRDFFGRGQRRVAVARAGDLEWQAFGHTQKDMEFQTGRQYSEKEIMRVFGIPEGYFSDKANRANAEQARATMIENAVWPRLTLLAEDLNAQWGGTWWSEDERVAFDDIRPRNIDQEIAIYNAESSIRTLDELRQLRNLDPIGDYRGKLLMEEIKKAAPMPATPASDEVEAAIAAAEEAAMAEVEAAAPEEPTDEAPAPEDGTLPELTPPEAEGDAPVDAEALKAREVSVWRRAALKDLKRGRAPAIAFEAHHLDPATATAIRGALEGAQDAEAVKAAFLKADDLDALIDATIGGAMAWARLALAGEG